MIDNKREATEEGLRAWFAQKGWEEEESTRLAKLIFRSGIPESATPLFDVAVAFGWLLQTPWKDALQAARWVCRYWFDHAKPEALNENNPPVEWDALFGPAQGWRTMVGSLVRQGEQGLVIATPVTGTGLLSTFERMATSVIQSVLPGITDPTIGLLALTAGEPEAVALPAGEIPTTPLLEEAASRQMPEYSAVAPAAIADFRQAHTIFRVVEPEAPLVVLGPEAPAASRQDVGVTLISPAPHIDVSPVMPTPPSDATTRIFPSPPAAMGMMSTAPEAVDNTRITMRPAATEVRQRSDTMMVRAPRPRPTPRWVWAALIGGVIGMVVVGIYFLLRATTPSVVSSTPAPVVRPTPTTPPLVPPPPAPTPPAPEVKPEPVVPLVPAAKARVKPPKKTWKLSASDLNKALPRLCSQAEKIVPTCKGQETFMPKCQVAFNLLDPGGLFCATLEKNVGGVWIRLSVNNVPSHQKMGRRERKAILQACGQAGNPFVCQATEEMANAWVPQR